MGLDSVVVRPLKAIRSRSDRRDYVPTRRNERAWDRVISGQRVVLAQHARAWPAMLRVGVVPGAETSTTRRLAARTRRSVRECSTPHEGVPVPEAGKGQR